MDERSGRVPSAHESGYCIIFFQSKISSPVEFVTHSSFPSLTVAVQTSVSDHFNIYIQQRCIQLIKNILTLQNISILNKCCSFELPPYQRILRTMITASTKILSSTTVFNIDSKKKCFLSTKSTFYSDF